MSSGASLAATVRVRPGECRTCGKMGFHDCAHGPITERAWDRWFLAHPEHSPAMMGLR